jgi:hypothetical protein
LKYECGVNDEVSKSVTYHCESCGEKTKCVDNMLRYGTSGYTSDMFANVLSERKNNVHSLLRK